MSNEATPTVIINATVGLSEIVKSAAHQRISAMEAEIKRLDDEYQRHSATVCRREERISEMLYDTAPPHIRAVIDAALDGMGASNAGVWWSAKDGASIDSYMVVIEPYSWNTNGSDYGITKSIEFRIKEWDPTPEIAALMEEAKASHKAAEAARDEAIRIGNLLRARDFRDRLEGELMSRFIEAQAPDIAKQIADVATDVTSPRLIGVKS